MATLRLLMGPLTTAPVAAIDYRDLVPFIFWPWLAWSCYVLVRRRAAKKAAGSSEASDTRSLAQPTSPFHTAPSAPPERGPEPSTRPLTPPDVPTGPTGEAPPTQTVAPDFSGLPPTSPPVAPNDERVIAPTMLGALPPTGGAVVGPGGSIFDAPASPDAGHSRKPIASIVTGIQLPCDLTPMVDFERPIGAREAVAFVTRGFDSGHVGQAMGAELRRLGFDLTPRHATEVVASRDDDWLAVAVHGDAGSVERGGRSAFPGAGDNAVVVELWTE